MTKAHRLATRKPKLPAKTLPLNFLLGCGQKDLEDFELARLSEVANLRKELHEILDRVIDAMSQAALASWFKAQDRQTLQHAIENEESPIEYAKRMVKEGQRSAEELLPMPAYEPGAAHRAAAVRYQHRQIEQGLCSECPEPLDRNSVRYCTRHLDLARHRAARKSGVKGEAGSADYLYGEITESKHGRQPGTLQTLALNREKQTRKILAEMGVPPESAATATQAAKAALMEHMPRSKKSPMTALELFDKAGLSGQLEGTAKNALKQLLSAGLIQRLGKGVSGDPFRYFGSKS
jgi:hypothetical protein